MSTLSRRQLLAASASSFAAFGWPLPKGHLASAFRDERKPSLVVLFLRGGADSLNMLVPYSEERYYELRPSLAVPREDTKQQPGVLPLNDDFGLHPSLSALMPLWKAGQLAPVLCAGSPHPTRSHFDAQDFMEYAAPGLRSERQGWLNRYLSASATAAANGLGTRGAGSGAAPEPSGEVELRGLAMQGLLPRSLRGPHPALAVPQDPVLEDDRILSMFAPLYGGGMQDARPPEGEAAAPGEEGAVERSGRDTLAALRKFRALTMESERSRESYPTGALGDHLRDLARVLQAGEGLEVAALDVGGWDTHINQGTEVGTMAKSLRILGDALGAFLRDIGPALESTLVMVMSEFGRTCAENGNYGTDHGHGGALWLLGGSVAGGRIHGDWSGLAERALYQQRDLPVTTDFRDVFSEVLRRHLRFDPPKDFFPDFKPRGVRGLFR